MKRIIDVPEQGLKACQLWIEMGVASWQDKVIANSIPYEEKPKYFPPCEDCNKKMEEIRQAYDKMKALEISKGETT